MKSLQLSPQAAAKELLRRRRARESLLDYAKAIVVPGAPASEDDEDGWVFDPVETNLTSHHVLLLQTLEKVALGEIPRLMVFMPPGSAKSTYGSVVFPTWVQGRWPGTKIILTSYGSKLARKHGRKARQIVRSIEYQSIFDATVSNDSAAADEWSLTNESEYLAGGLLSGLTGNRAHGLIIDDPIKGRQEADSETVRQSTREAYEDDARTRLVPGGWEIIIQTRWHEADLAGGLLPEGYEGESGNIKCTDGQVWYVLCLQAQAERDDDPLGRKKGEYLWPEWFTPEHFAKFKRNKRTWSALYQQKPQPDEGIYFKREWFDPNFYFNLPKHLRYYGASDYAVTEDGGDFTVHGIFGVDPLGEIYIVAWWRDQVTADVWIDEQIALGRKYKPLIWGGESGVIRRSVEPYLKRRMREAKFYINMEWMAPVSDKPARARSFQALAAQGKVHLPDEPWAHELLGILLRFPTGAVDDDVDVCSLFGRMLEDVIPAYEPEDDQSDDSKSDYGNDDDDEEESWITA